MVTILNFLVVLMPRNEKNTIQRFEENDKLNKSSSLHLVILRKEDVASAAAVCDMKGNLVADRIFAIHHAGHGSLQGAFSSYNQLAFTICHM